MLEYLLSEAVPWGLRLRSWDTAWGETWQPYHPVAPVSDRHGRQGGHALILFPVFTFAAPTAGNTQFAAAFDAQFPNSWRYYNALDLRADGLHAEHDSDDGTCSIARARRATADQVSVTYDNKTVTLAEAFGLIATAVFLAEGVEGFGSSIHPIIGGRTGREARSAPGLVLSRVGPGQPDRPRR